jgi:hypothetical protein
LVEDRCAQGARITLYSTPAGGINGIRLAEVSDHPVDGASLAEVDHANAVGLAGGQDEGQVAGRLPPGGRLPLVVTELPGDSVEVADLQADELDQDAVRRQSTGNGLPGGVLQPLADVHLGDLAGQLRFQLLLAYPPFGQRGAMAGQFSRAGASQGSVSHLLAQGEQLLKLGLEVRILPTQNGIALHGEGLRRERLALEDAIQGIRRRLGQVPQDQRQKAFVLTLERPEESGALLFGADGADQPEQAVLTGRRAEHHLACLRQAILRHQQEAEVGEAGGGVGVVVAQHPAADGQRLLIVRPRSRVVPLRAQQGAEVIEASGGLGVVLTQHPAADGQHLLEVRPRCRVVPHRFQEDAEAVEAGSGVGVVVAQHPPADGQRLFIVPSRCRVVPHRVQQEAEVVEAGGSVGMVRSQHPAPDRQRLLEVGSRRRVVPLRLQNSSQVVEAGGGVGVVRTQHPAADGQRLFIVPSRCRVVPLRAQQGTQVVEAGSGVRVVVAQHPAVDGQRLLVVGPRCRVVSLRTQQEAEVVEAGGGVGVVLTPHPAADVQRPVKVQPRCRVVPPSAQQNAKVVEAGSGVGVVLTQHLAGQLDRLLGQRHCRRRTPLLKEGHGSTVQLFQSLVHADLLRNHPLRAITPPHTPAPPPPGILPLRPPAPPVAAAPGPAAFWRRP